jgi:inhibitor of KinA sporulation pathway (predicted exonuclease)
MAWNAINGYVQHCQRPKLSKMDQTLMSLEDDVVDRAEILAMAT